MVLGWAYECNVQVFSVDEGKLRAHEQYALLPRPCQEFIGDERLVMVLETDTQLYSLLNRADFDALTANGVVFPPVLVATKEGDGVVHVVVGQEAGMKIR